MCVLYVQQGHARVYVFGAYEPWGRCKLTSQSYPEHQRMLPQVPAEKETDCELSCSLHGRGTRCFLHTIREREGGRQGGKKREEGRERKDEIKGRGKDGD